MAIMAETMANQITDKESRILRIDTKEVIEDESVGTVKQIENQTRSSVKTLSKSSDNTPKGTPTNIWPPQKIKFLMFNKNPVQESLKTLHEVLLLKNYCALFWCLYIACQACKTSKSESRIITGSKWVWRLKIRGCCLYVVMHSRKAHRDSWFIMLIPMWSSSLSQAFTATIYVSEL